MSAEYFTIGTALDNDLQVSVPEVSAHHARLVKTLDGLFIEDLGSTNAVFVDGERVTHAKLRIGTPVMLSYRFRLPWDDARLQSWVNLPLEAQGERTLPTVLYRFSLADHGKDVLIIGRSESCDLIVPHPRVSRTHAQFVRGADGTWSIEDSESKNGTFVDGRRVSRAPLTADSRLALAGLPIAVFPALGLMEARVSAGEARIELSNVSFCVAVKSGARTLLNDISLVINPGEFVGLIGPSGSGKTTLMLVINGYNEPTSGSVRINDVNVSREKQVFQGFIGYVPQDDIIHRELVVERSLRYNAELRLPDLEAEERSREVDRVIADLDLENTRQTEIGTPDKKGLSGGQRKRVNLAQELITQPSVLLLDEPCSGLDPKNDSDVMKLLRDLSHKGKTLVLTTHGVTEWNFRLLDNLIVLAEGGVLAYYGPAREAVHFFGVAEPRLIFDVLESVSPAEWQRRYRESPYYTRYVTARSTRHSSDSPAAPLMKAHRRWSQLGVLCKRYSEIKWRDRLLSAILFAQAPIIGVLLAMVFNSLGESEERPFPFIHPLFFLVISAIWLGASNAAREIVLERAIYRRERSVFLRVHNYLLSKLIVLAVFNFLQCLVLLCVSYHSCHLEGSFAGHLLILFMVSCTATAMGLLVSGAVTTEAAAMALVPLVLIPQVVLGGMAPRLNEMNELLKPFAAVMISRWGFEAALLVESDTAASQWGFSSGNLPVDLLAICAWFLIYAALTYRRLATMK